MPNYRRILERARQGRPKRAERHGKSRDETRVGIHTKSKSSRARILLSRLRQAIDPAANRQKLADTLKGLEDKIRGDGRSRTRGFFGNYVASLREKLEGSSKVADAIDRGLRRDDPTKTVTSSDDLRKALNEVEDIAEVNMRQIGRDLADGRITTEEFRDRMQVQIRQSHTLATIIGQGGIGNMTENTLDMQDRQTSKQLRYLDRFVADTEKRIENGQSLSNVPNRAGSYSRSVRPQAIEVQRQRIVDEAGDDGAEERRVLDRAAEHCDKCEQYARLSWQPIGSLPAIGTQSPCGSRCRCKFEYRTNRSV